MEKIEWVEKCAYVVTDCMSMTHIQRKPEGDADYARRWFSLEQISHYPMSVSPIVIGVERQQKHQLQFYGMFISEWDNEIFIEWDNPELPFLISARWGTSAALGWETQTSVCYQELRQMPILFVLMEEQKNCGVQPYFINVIECQRGGV